ncbi:hypothetical protein [Legionella oakridgensis]|uniref:hypothetical protein n=1 Tax=Legionella oakridgensis TaxID=29423 RepID=UPI0003DE227B|nr:hypothetical protein [Legionella oakridgensis]ETO92155.1 hypothetical protein LOR_70c19710 [Legionella oakridgensis RV-2-2007]
MNESLIKLRFTIDRYSLRERVMILFAAFAVLFFLWLFLMYYPQKRALIKTNLAIQNEMHQAAELLQRSQTIKSMATDDTVAKLMAKFARLQEEMRQLEGRVARYEQRFIGKKQLAKLLYAIMKQTGGVRIDDFSNTEYLRGEAAQKIDMASLTTTVASSPMNKKSTAAQLPVDAVHLPVERTQYTLTLSGDYFSIMHYLQRLEQLQWQLYWDKLDYTVVSYPLAKATVQFYTLRPGERERKNETGAVK